MCIYQAESPEAIRAHAGAAGIPADEIAPVADTGVTTSEARVGKTRLVDQVAGESGATVLWGRARKGEATPYGAIMRAPFALGAQPLRELLADFRDVGVGIRIAAVRLPSAGELLRRQQVASPLAGPLSELDDETRHALARDVVGALRPHADDDGVCFPMETHVVTATR